MDESTPRPPPHLTLDEIRALAMKTQIELAEVIGAKLAQFREASLLPVAGLKIDVARHNGKVGVRLMVTL